MVDVSKLLGLDKFEKVLSRYIKEPVKIKPSQCYTYRDKSYKCELCVKVCHSQALTLEDHVIKIDENLCDGCGLCYSICPTGAFQLEEDAKTVLSKVKLFVETNDLLICKCIKTSDDEGEKENATALETVCLGRLDESLLLGAAALGAEKIWLDSSKCSDCDYHAKEIIEKHVSSVKDLLSSFDKELDITFSDERPSILDEEATTDLTELEKGSRRDFFSNIGKSLMNSGADMASERIDKIMESIKPSEQSIYDSNLPEKRNILLMMLSHLGKPVEESLSNETTLFTDIEIDDTCVFCNNCTTFCPTLALTRSKGETKGIEFNAAHCVNCQLCEFVCPNRSLKVDGSPSWQELLTGEKRMLIEGKLYQCQKCHQYFESVTASKECHACELRRKKLGDDSWY